MVVKTNANVLTVITDIVAAQAKKGFADLTARDEKGNEKYRVVVNKDGKGALDTHSITTNTEVDGKLAAVIVEPEGTTLDDLKQKYGKALLAADKYIKAIAAATVSENDAIDAMFDTTDTTEAE